MGARHGSNSPNLPALNAVHELVVGQRSCVVLEIINIFRNASTMKLVATDYSLNTRAKSLYLNHRSYPSASEVVVYIPRKLVPKVKEFERVHQMITSCYAVVTNATIQMTSNNRDMEIGTIVDDKDIDIYSPSEMEILVQNHQSIKKKVESLLQRRDLLLNGAVPTESNEITIPKVPNRPSCCSIKELKDNTTVEVSGQIIYYEQYSDSIKLWITDYAPSGNINDVPKNAFDYCDLIKLHSLFIVIRNSYFDILKDVMPQIDPVGCLIRFHNLRINSQPGGKGKIGLLNIRQTSLNHDISEVEFLPVNDRRSQNIAANRLKFEKDRETTLLFTNKEIPDGYPHIFNHESFLPKPAEQGPAQPVSETREPRDNNLHVAAEIIPAPENAVASKDLGGKRVASSPPTPEKVSKVQKLAAPEESGSIHSDKTTIYSHFLTVSKENIIPIKEIKETINVDKNRKLVVKGKIVDYIPREVIETVQNYNGMCDFRFVLLIEDKSGGHLPVIYCGDGIVDLLGLSASMAALYGFQKYSSLFEKLVSLTEELELCVYEYHIPDDKGNKKITRWQGFGTRLHLQ